MPSSPAPNTEKQTRRPSRSFPLGRLIIPIALVALVAILLAFAPVRGALATRATSSSVRRFFATPWQQQQRQQHPAQPQQQRTMVYSSKSSSACDSSCTSTSGSSGAKPKLSAAEERQWNRLADHMDHFHNYFRLEFNEIYQKAGGSFHKSGQTLPSFLREARGLYEHLDMHHRIEEAYIFPVLARKMPQFKAGAREAGEHLKSHKAIHDGLERYEQFLKDSLADPSKYNAGALRGIMDGFREVLFRHLDEEVHDLGGESMRAAGWTLNELKAIPM